MQRCLLLAARCQLTFCFIQCIDPEVAKGTEECGRGRIMWVIGMSDFPLVAHNANKRTLPDPSTPPSLAWNVDNGSLSRRVVPPRWLNQGVRTGPGMWDTVGLRSLLTLGRDPSVWKPINMHAESVRTVAQGLDCQRVKKLVEIRLILVQCRTMRLRQSTIV